MRWFNTRARKLQAAEHDGDDAPHPHRHGSSVVAVAPREQPIELGTIAYKNLSANGRHGRMDVALHHAAETGKPIFANFVEWEG